MFAPNKIDPYTGEDRARYASRFLDFFNAFSPIPAYNYPESEIELLAKEHGITIANRNDDEMSFDGNIANLTPEQLRNYNKSKGYGVSSTSG